MEKLGGEVNMGKGERGKSNCDEVERDGYDDVFDEELEEDEEEDTVDTFLWLIIKSGV